MFVTESLVQKLIDIEQTLCNISHPSHPATLTRKFATQSMNNEIIAFLTVYGINISYKQLAKTKRKLTPLASDTIHHLVRNFENVNKFINSLSEKIITLSILQQIHKTISTNLFDYWDLGRLRNKNDLPQTSLEAINFKTPETLKAPEDITKLLHQINNLPWLFGIFTWLKEYPNILSFSMNNMGIYYLVPKLILALHNKKAAAFIPTVTVVKQYLNEYKSKDTEEAKLQLLTELFLQQSLETHKLLQNIQNKSVQRELDLNPRQLKIINFLKRHRKVTRALYAKQFNVSFMTAYRDLKQLTKLGVLEKKGSGKATFYIYKG